jgi:hypothetical protein
MKFILFVEGWTESVCVPAFLKRWLDVRLEKRVGVKPVRFEGCVEFEREMSKKAIMYLNGPDQADIVGVVGLLDLYGPTFYPENTTTASERLSWATTKLEKRVGHDKFKMFFAVHEVEAWLLSDPTLFPREVGRALRSESEHPEEVNFDNPPSKRLNDVYFRKTDRGYKKTTHGSQLFAKLDPDVAASKCPQLRCMLECMLEMAKNAGEKADQL